jgi:hypothetical protein
MCVCIICGSEHRGNQIFMGATPETVTERQERERLWEAEKSGEASGQQ